MFHPVCHGGNITVSSQLQQAKRKPDTYDNGVVFSSSPIDTGQIVKLLFKQTAAASRWDGVPSVGFTNRNPDCLGPEFLPSIYVNKLYYDTCTWTTKIPSENQSTQTPNLFVQVYYEVLNPTSRLPTGLVTLMEFGQKDILIPVSGAVDFTRPVWLTIDIGSTPFCEVVNYDAYAYSYNSPPYEPSPNVENVYLQQLLEGSKTVQHARLIFIGQQGVGKTSLIKVITGQRFDPEESPTRGIDTSLTASISSTSQPGIWLPSKDDITQLLHSSAHHTLLSIWDCPENSPCYTLQQIFLSDRAIYIVVFNLCHDLDKPANGQTDGETAGDGDDLTAWEVMDNRMQTVYDSIYRTNGAAAPPPPQQCPLFIIVGTHRNELSCDEKERETLFTAKFDQIRRAIQSKAYKAYISDKYFAVDSNVDSDTDTEILHLRNLIEGYLPSLPQFTQEIPLSWLSPLPFVSFAPMQHFRQMKQDIEAIPPETRLRLQFFHELGYIAYLDGPVDGPISFAIIGDAIIIKTSWLVELFTSIATNDPDNETPALATSWKQLREGGVLEDRLLMHLLKTSMIREKDEVVSELKVKLIATNILMNYGVLCKQHPTEMEYNRSSIYGEGRGNEWWHSDDSSNTATNTVTFFAPSLMRPLPTPTLPTQHTASTVFFIEFSEIISEGLFTRLVVRALTWSQMQRREEEPVLHYKYASFFIASDHQVEMTPFEQACIRVCVSQPVILRTGGSVRFQPEPSVSATCTVKSFFQSALNSMKKGPLGKHILFRLCVGCPCEATPLHLLPLSDCLSKDRVPCPQQKALRIETQPIKEKFVMTPQSPRTDLQYLLSDKHLLEIATALGPEWERMATLLDFTTGDVYRFKMENYTVDSQIFCMLITWSQKTGGDQRCKAIRLGEALKGCTRTDLYESLVLRYSVPV